MKIIEESAREAKRDLRRQTLVLFVSTLIALGVFWIIVQIAMYYLSMF